LLLLLIGASAAAVTMGYSVFAGGGSDTSGYVAAAESLRSGRLFRPSPLELLPQIAAIGAASSPLGYVPAGVTGTEVPVYPLGFPYLMAAFVAVCGPLAAYAVTPLSFGMLVVVCGRIGRSIGDDSTGLATALLVALDPAGILNGIWALSDLPAATC